MDIKFIQGRVILEGVYGEPEISPSTVIIDGEEFSVSGELTENEAIRTALLKRAVSNSEEGLTLEDIGVEPIKAEVEDDEDFIINNVDMFFDIIYSEVFIPNRNETILKVKEGLLSDEEKEIYFSLEEEKVERPNDEDINLSDDLGLEPIKLEIFDEKKGIINFEIVTLADFKSAKDNSFVLWGDRRTSLYYKINSKMKEMGWEY